MGPEAARYQAHPPVSDAAGAKGLLTSERGGAFCMRYPCNCDRRQRLASHREHGNLALTDRGVERRAAEDGAGVASARA
jgi:hypothetical protein